MRKPRDFDAELKALNEKAAMLKSRKVQQFGELVIATGADSLSIDELTGALASIAATQEPVWAEHELRLHGQIVLVSDLPEIPRELTRTAVGFSRE